MTCPADKSEAIPPPVFSDEHVKRAKIASESNKTSERLSLEELKALLARLEAGDAYINAQGPSTERAEVLLKVYRKSAGK